MGPPAPVVTPSWYETIAVDPEVVVDPGSKVVGVAVVVVVLDVVVDPSGFGKSKLSLSKYSKMFLKTQNRAV